ncbi:MAG: radical SAM protein [Spirochaetales bacterium]|nr:radical SAM protein [Spirochaetales bacterium]
MVGEQLYGFKKVGAMLEMLKSPIMKTLSPRQLMAMNYVANNSKLTRVGDRVYMNTFTPYFPSLAYERYVGGILQTVQGKPTPVMMNFAVTANCICNCWHCSFSDRTKKNQLSVAELKDAIGQVQDLGTSMIGFTGGEPLLRDDIEDIISLVGDRSMSLMFSTGWSLTRERVRSLKSAGLGIPVVSLDHYDSAKHDKRRGKEGMHAIAIKAIEMYQAEGMYVAVSFVPDHELISNPEELYKTLDFFKSLGVNDMRLTSPILSGQLTEHPEEKLSKEDVKRVQQVQKFLVKHKGYPACFAYDVFESEKFYGCGAGFHFIFVDSSGNCCPCDFCSVSLGNMRERPISEIWQEYTKIFRAPGCHCYANVISEPIANLHTTVRPLSIDQSRQIISQCPSFTPGKVPVFYRKMGFKWDADLLRHD